MNLTELLRHAAKSRLSGKAGELAEVRAADKMRQDAVKAYLTWDRARELIRADETVECKYQALNDTDKAFYMDVVAGALALANSVNVDSYVVSVEQSDGSVVEIERGETIAGVNQVMFPVS